MDDVWRGEVLQYVLHSFKSCPRAADLSTNDLVALLAFRLIHLTREDLKGPNLYHVGQLHDSRSATLTDRLR